ncbi:GvpL/GvpF family gas vesicle protein [Streptomyces sp. NBC_00210]|uniref:GvpL/GvpF family gas vesicle protein n=2 Tax=Streptomyces TaxID=1883 RepID=UPI003249C48A
MLERLMTDGSLLPLRFGTVAPNDEAVRHLLKAQADTYREIMSAFRRCTECGTELLDARVRRIYEQSGDLPEWCFVCMSKAPAHRSLVRLAGRGVYARASAEGLEGNP